MLSFAAALVAISCYAVLGHEPGGRVRKPSELNAIYDYVIVGGGTAGCVLAARLTEDPLINVLVLEAGGEETGLWFSHIPAYSMNVVHDANFSWGYLTTPQNHCCSSFKNRQVPVDRAKVLGGCSTHNMMNYVRCSPFDFDHWANDLGNHGWRYEDVLPYFKKIEAYEIDHLQGRSDQHGYEGLLKIKEVERSKLGYAIEKSLKDANYTFLDDTNGPKQDGFSVLQLNVDKRGSRMSAVKAYLRPAMERPNLHVVVHAHASKVILEKIKDKIRASGVEYLNKGTKYTVSSTKEVIVFGGAINSPQILMLSGIGPKEHLESFSIPVLVDNPAVGANLNNHILALLVFKAAKEAAPEALKIDTWEEYVKYFNQYLKHGTGPFSSVETELLGFEKSGLLPGPWPDLQLFYMNTYTPDVNETFAEVISKFEFLFALRAFHLHPSDKGEIRLRSADPLAHPLIDPHWFESSIDIDVLAKGLRMWLDLVKSSLYLKDLNVQFAEKPLPGCENFQLLSDEYLKCHIRSKPFDGSHHVGTCRMGPKGENSVVDNELRVHGVDGLRVVDASVFPDQVSGNTHAPVIMVAEKAADLIKNSIGKSG